MALNDAYMFPTQDLTFEKVIRDRNSRTSQALREVIGVGGGDGEGSGPASVDTLIGATDLGKKIAKATSPAAARALIDAASPAQITAAVAALVDASPASLDTLKELAAALGNDANFATTVTAAIAQKYTRPSTGIPETDLSSGVRTSLSKADSALQPTAADTRYVRTVNNSGPDATGNVTIAAGSGSGQADTVDSLGGTGATGRAVMKSADAAAARSAIGAGTSNLAVGTASTDAKAGNYQPTASNISDATTIGRNVLRAADAAAIRTILDAASPAQVTAAVAAVVDASPASLDTLKELAAALGNDSNFAANVTAAIAAKYTKPADGIPASDLTTAAQSALTRATSSITSVNGVRPDGSGNVAISIGSTVPDASGRFIVRVSGTTLFATDYKKAGPEKQIATGLDIGTQAPMVMGNYALFYNASGTALTSIDLTSGYISPVQAVAGVTIWGSSSASRLGYMGNIQTVLGTTVYMQAVGGETIEHSAARANAVPALVTPVGGSIPASGAVQVTFNNSFPNQSVTSIDGTLAGIPGTLAYAASPSPRYNFTRTTSGSATTVAAGTPFIANAGVTRRDNTTIIWTGKNNLSAIDPSEEARVIDYTQKHWDRVGAFVKRRLVLGHFYNDGWSTQLQAQLDRVNSAYAAAYGDFYVDIQSYITGSTIWADAGVTPTTTDLSTQASGFKPPSLSGDSAHLNEAGYTAVAKMLKRKFEALEWLVGAAPLPPAAVLISDGFSGTGELNGRSTDSSFGGTTTAWTTTLATRFNVSGGRLTMTPAAGDAPAATIACPSDAEVTMRMVQLPSNAGTSLYLDLRRDGTTGLRLRVGSSSVDLRTRVNNVTTTLSTIVPGISNGDVVGIRAKGSSLALLLNGNVIETFTNSAIPTGSVLAIASYNGSAADTMVIDDLIVRAVA